MNLALYTTASDPRAVSKQLTQLATVTAVATANINILMPSLRLNYNSAYLSANYCYISEFSRYYFIASHNVEVGKQIILNCEVDVLMTYADEIKNCTACVIRNGGIGRPTSISDDKLPINPNKKTYQVLQFNAVENYPFDIPNNNYPYTLEVL